MTPLELINELKELGFNETQIAKRSGITQPTVHRIANGISKNPRYDNYEKLKDLYDKTKTPSCS